MEKKYLHSLITIALLLTTIVYGLMLRPFLWQQAALPLETIFLVASCATIGYLLVIGVQWLTIQQAIVQKLSQATSTLLLLFAIGILIGCWMISGTIPLLVYYGLTLISPDHFFLVAFISPIFFSLCTGTSWASIATIGLVLITVASVIGADLGITAGAIIGGAYFGDKLSPLSDTTNIAAIAVKIDVYQHIHSMLVTTLPAALIAAIGFALLDVNTTLASAESSLHVTILDDTLSTITQLFYLSPLLLLPAVVIIGGAVTRKPTLPTLMLSSFVACVLAISCQQVSISAIFQTLYQGFEVSMLPSFSMQQNIPDHFSTLFNRGGLYALNSPIIIIILVFVYIGALDTINALPTVINKVLNKLSSKASLITATLISSAIVNAMTSSQYANSFVVGEAYREKYDQLKLHRKVLSRSLEDTGTMVESLIPWSTTAVFIYASLNVSISDYWPWQFLSIANIIIAFIFAWLGIGQFVSPYTPNGTQKDTSHD